MFDLNDDSIVDTSKHRPCIHQMTQTFGPLLEHPYPKTQENMQQHLRSYFQGWAKWAFVCISQAHMHEGPTQQLLLIVNTSLVDMESNT